MATRMSVWTERSQKSICCLKATRYTPFAARYGRANALPRYAARTAPRCGARERKRPLSRQQVAASSPYRRGANMGLVAPFVRRYRSEIRSATRAQAHIVANTFGALLSMTNGARASSGAQRALIFQTNNLRKADSFRR